MKNKKTWIIILLVAIGAYFVGFSQLMWVQSNKLSTQSPQNLSFNMAERCQEAAIRLVDSNNQANALSSINGVWDTLSDSWYNSKDNKCYAEIRHGDPKGGGLGIINSLSGEALGFIGSQAIDQAFFQLSNSNGYISNSTESARFDNLEQSLGKPIK